MEIEIWKSNLNLKFEIRFKQKSKFEFYVLFFVKLKIDKKICFIRLLSVMWLIRGKLRCRKDFVKKRTEVHFSIFIENRNWDLKFVFRFDNENEKRKKFQILLNVPFDPRITDDPCTESIIRSLISKQKEFWEFFIFHFSIS